MNAKAPRRQEETSETRRHKEARSNAHEASPFDCFFVLLRVPSCLRVKSPSSWRRGALAFIPNSMWLGVCVREGITSARIDEKRNARTAIYTAIAEKAAEKGRFLFNDGAGNEATDGSVCGNAH